jgi:hypothetical protein
MCTHMREDNIVSTLLYADFLPAGETVLAAPLKALLRQALAKAGRDRTPVSQSRYLRGKRFVTLQVTAVADEGEESVTRGITVPPIKSVKLRRIHEKIFPLYIYAFKLISSRLTIWNTL